MASNINEKCEDTISSLMQEIQELKEKYEANKGEIAFLFSNSMKQSLQEKYKDENVTFLKSNIQTKLANYEKEIQLFKQITGIEITKYLKKKEHKSENIVLYNHKLEGQCQFLQYEMEFKTAESQQGKEQSLCKVTQVSIHMDFTFHPDLAKLAERTKTSMDLLGFFRLLAKYADWCQFRRKTFTWCKEKYPNAIGLPWTSSAEYMVLRNPDLPGCHLILLWRITINEEGAVIPILELLPKIPEQAATLDQTGVLESSVPALKNLLQVFGIQESIKKIIQSFCLPKVNIRI